MWLITSLICIYAIILAVYKMRKIDDTGYMWLLAVYTYLIAITALFWVTNHIDIDLDFLLYPARIVIIALWIVYLHRK